MQRIFLTGLPGSGKSSVGRNIAALLGWDFIDTDDLLAAVLASISRRRSMLVAAG